MIKHLYTCARFILNFSFSKIAMPVFLSGSNRNIFQRAKNYVTCTWAMIAIVLAFVFVTLLVFALPISQIIIGSLYIHSCPMNDLIPIYLIVAGILTFIFLIISIVKVKANYFDIDERKSIIFIDFCCEYNRLEIHSTCSWFYLSWLVYHCQFF